MSIYLRMNVKTLINLANSLILNVNYTCGYPLPICCDAEIM